MKESCFSAAVTEISESLSEGGHQPYCCASQACTVGCHHFSKLSPSPEEWGSISTNVCIRVCLMWHSSFCRWSWWSLGCSFPADLLQTGTQLAWFGVCPCHSPSWLQLYPSNSSPTDMWHTQHQKWQEREYMLWAGADVISWCWTNRSVILSLGVIYPQESPSFTLATIILGVGIAAGWRKGWFKREMCIGGWNAFGAMHQLWLFLWPSASNFISSPVSTSFAILSYPPLVVSRMLPGDLLPTDRARKTVSNLWNRPVWVKSKLLQRHLAVSVASVHCMPLGLKLVCSNLPAFFRHPEGTTYSWCILATLMPVPLYSFCYLLLIHIGFSVSQV